ncbi:P-type conjugative transfer protein TrbL, partial [Sphingomonas sp. AR_OL41]|nr:P-type conjugative transfer protein TrbL [Sphingomonas sp. AR_OL41]
PLRRAGEALKGAAAKNGGDDAPAGQGRAADAGQPAWAVSMKHRHAMTQAASIAVHTLRSGDGGASGASVDTSEKD